jgi:TetR/AcrR family transcriptional repressor of nem operon
MRLTKAQRQENHDRIVRVAAKLFREKGVDGVGIDEIMAQAGLTHGAFYGHFPSKTALVAEASLSAMESSRVRRTVADDTKPSSFRDFARRYLTTRHRDDPGQGCAVAALAADLGRQDESVKAQFAGELEKSIDALAAGLPGGPEEARAEAIVRFATLVGALTMSRGAGAGALSEELLDTVRMRLEAAG